MMIMMKFRHMENQIETNMEHEMNPGLRRGLSGLGCGRLWKFWSLFGPHDNRVPNIYGTAKGTMILPTCLIVLLIIVYSV